MIFVHTQKFLRTSPRKVREVVRMIRGLSSEKAIEVLPHVDKKASVPVLKTLKTAVANAVNSGAERSGLILKEIQVGEGPKQKRHRAGARGRAKPYKRRLSHIRIVLESERSKKLKQKKEVKKETKLEKIEKGGKK